jgi:hypothetical protein
MDSGIIKVLSLKDIKFSPNGKFIAYGTHGDKPVVEILTIEENN